MDNGLQDPWPSLDCLDCNSPVYRKVNGNIEPFGIAAQLRSDKCSRGHLSNQGQDSVVD
jgi:hypothetical protein